MAAVLACALGAVGIATTTTAAAAVPAKITPKSDPCSVLTQADLSGLSATYTISSSTSELEGTCTYSLESDGGNSPLQLTVESSIGYTAQKAVTKKQKKISGLSGGYTGELNGSAEAAYKEGKAGVRLWGSNLSSADLVKVLKAIHQRAG
jgi:hypothetical protein